MPYKMDLIPIKPLAYGYSYGMGRYKGRYRYPYTIEYNWLPSYWTFKRYLRKYIVFNPDESLKAKSINEIKFKEGYIEVHRLSNGYTYQYIPYNKPPKCMLIIDPRNRKFYTTKEELKRLIKDYNLKSVEDAVQMCRVQAVTYLNLLNRIKEIQAGELQVRTRLPRKWIEKVIRKEFKMKKLSIGRHRSQSQSPS